MAINPLQLPAYAAPRDLDFSSLAQLPQIHKQAQQDASRRKALSLANIEGEQGLRRAINNLVAVGDLEGATKLASIQKTITQR